jgi:hypothetical protein
MHKKQPDGAGEVPNYDLIAGKEIIDERTCRQYKIHGVYTCNTVFEVLLEPIAIELESVIISESDEEARKHKENGYPDMKFGKKAPDKMRELRIKNVGKMRNKNQVSGQCTYAG